MLVVNPPVRCLAKRGLALLKLQSLMRRIVRAAIKARSVRQGRSSYRTFPLSGQTARFHWAGIMRSRCPFGRALASAAVSVPVAEKTGPAISRARLFRCYPCPLTSRCPSFAVRRSICRPKRNSFALGFAADSSLRPLKFEAHDARRCVAFSKNLQRFDFARFPRLAGASFVFGILFSRSFSADR